mgnify:CR=1 FL=1
MSRCICYTTMRSYYDRSTGCAPRSGRMQSLVRTLPERVKPTIMVTITKQMEYIQESLGQPLITSVSVLQQEQSEGMPDLQSFQDYPHYSFKNATLLEEAFIADGAAASRDDVDGPRAGNKRLALIGDAVLRLSVLDEWFPEGESTGEFFVTYHLPAKCLKRMVTRWFRRSRQTMSWRR